MSNTELSTRQTPENEWDVAIADAEEELRAIAKRRVQLHQALQTFRENRRDGVPWPGRDDDGKGDG